MENGFQHIIFEFKSSGKFVENKLIIKSFKRFYKMYVISTIATIIISIFLFLSILLWIFIFYKALPQESPLDENVPDIPYLTNSCDTNIYTCSSEEREEYCTLYYDNSNVRSKCYGFCSNPQIDLNSCESMDLCFMLSDTYQEFKIDIEPFLECPNCSPYNINNCSTLAIVASDLVYLGNNVFESNYSENPIININYNYAINDEVLDQLAIISAKVEYIDDISNLRLIIDNVDVIDESNDLIGFHEEPILSYMRLLNYTFDRGFITITATTRTSSIYRLGDYTLEIYDTNTKIKVLELNMFMNYCMAYRTRDGDKLVNKTDFKFEGTSSVDYELNTSYYIELKYLNE